MVVRTNPVVKLARDIISTDKELKTLENELSSELSLSSPESPTTRDIELLKIAKKRFDLNDEINPILKEIHPLSRKKGMSSEEQSHLKELQARRDEIFATLKQMPALGKTHSEWEALGANETRSLGRPGVSLELRILREKAQIQVLAEELSAENKVLSAECKKEVNATYGGHPLTLDYILKNKDLFKSARIKSSSTTKEISKCERDILRLNKEIDHIESGKAQKERDAIILERQIKKLSMGRPFEPLSEKLVDLKNKKLAKEEQIEMLERSLSPYEQTGRKVTVARKDLKEQLELVEANGLDIKDDASHSIVEEYRRKELIHKNFVVKRRAFKKKQDNESIFSGFDFYEDQAGTVAEAQEVESEPEKSGVSVIDLVLHINEKAPVSAPVSQKVEVQKKEVDLDLVSQNEKQKLKEHMLETARAKAKIKMKAKMLMKKKLEAKEDDSSQSDVDSDKNALSSIFG
ncbi:hypothetical protein [Psychromonas sp. SP041]|uniref:hypothetical protein n=1 Tax=Psychromonas sp. SP041 TaxID=1365007 RepID=UPI0010C79CED|nr:hypothetical protein [Psychromonas sp. SP041]